MEFCYSKASRLGQDKKRQCLWHMNCKNCVDIREELLKLQNKDKRMVQQKLRGERVARGTKCTIVSDVFEMPNTDRSIK